MRTSTGSGSNEANPWCKRGGRRYRHGVLVSIPLPADRVFRNRAMDGILALLYRNPHGEFGVRELRDVIGHGAQTVDTVVPRSTVPAADVSPNGRRPKLYQWVWIEYRYGK